jgi:uncharacterized protein with PIN domain
MLSLYMDEDSLDEDLTHALRAAGFDVVRTSETGRRSAIDDDQLAFATSQGRIIVTANQRDYARLHQQWVRIGRNHAGIIIRVQTRDVGAELRAFQRLAGALTQGDVKDQVVYLNNWFETPV